MVGDLWLMEAINASVTSPKLREREEFCNQAIEGKNKKACSPLFSLFDSSLSPCTSAEQI